MGGCCKPSKSESSKASEGELKRAIEGKKKLLVWILGGPGSGKGTQCKMLALHFKLAHLSTGDLLRKCVSENPDCPHSREIKKAMEKGQLADTTLVLDLLLNEMCECFENCNGYLIDGYPREVEQGELFCQKIGQPHLIVFLDCPDPILEERLVKRGAESGRVDDNLETIRKRLQTFHDISKPVINRWMSKVVTIDGSLVPLEVEQECIRVIEELQERLKGDEDNK